MFPTLPCSCAHLSTVNLAAFNLPTEQSAFNLPVEQSPCARGEVRCCFLLTSPRKRLVFHTQPFRGEPDFSVEKSPLSYFVALPSQPQRVSVSPPPYSHIPPKSSILPHLCLPCAPQASLLRSFSLPTHHLCPRARHSQ